MCIIVYKPKGQASPKKSILQECFNRNKDGAGYMFVYNNFVTIKKGFMNFEEFYKSYIKDYNKYNLNKKNVVMHFRIGTSGGINRSKTHPFPLCKNDNLLNQIYLRCKDGVVHNGILSEFEYDEKLSDTQAYIKDLLIPIKKLDKKTQDIIINATLGTSKLIILHGDDNIEKYGHFIEENGIYYSNSTYKKIDYSSWYNKNWKKGYDYYGWDL